MKKNFKSNSLQFFSKISKFFTDTAGIFLHYTTTWSLKIGFLQLQENEKLMENMIFLTKHQLFNIYSLKKTLYVYFVGNSDLGSKNAV